MGTSWTAKMDEVEVNCINNCPHPPPPVGCDVNGAVKAEEHCDILQNTGKAFSVGSVYLHFQNKYSPTVST
jgi:hypothetical protein